MAPLLTPNADHTVRDRESTLRLAHQNTCCCCFWSRLPSLNRLFYCYILSPAVRRHCHVVPSPLPPLRLATDSTRSSWLSNSWFTVLRTRINVLVPSYSLLVLSLSAHAEIALSVKVGQRNQLCWERCPHRTSPLPFFLVCLRLRNPEVLCLSVNYDTWPNEYRYNSYIKSLLTWYVKYVTMHVWNSKTH